MAGAVGGWNRRELIASMRSWSRANWTTLCVLIVAMGGAAIGLSLLLGPSYWGGFAAGALVAVLIVLLVVAPVVGSGELHRVWGVEGERATAELLESRQRRRQGWDVVHGLELGGHEIDHIASGPGGVLAIETKWTNHRWSVVDGTLRGPLSDPIRQASRSARQVQALLSGPTGGRIAVVVDAFLVIWGPGCPEIPDGMTVIDGVQVVSGRDLSRFVSRLDSSEAGHENWRDAQVVLREYATSQERVRGLPLHDR
jgi:hypothetical protein